MDDESRDVYYELWKNVNGHSLEGKVLTAMTAYSYKQFYPVTVVTEKNVYEADFKTYVQTGIGNDMFYLPRTSAASLSYRPFRISSPMAWWNTLW